MGGSFPAGMSSDEDLFPGCRGRVDLIMRSDLLWFLPRAEPEPEEEESGYFDIGDHDPVLRYAVLGIFVIMATAALSIARPVALPVTAGIVFGLVLGPIADSLVRRGVPHGLAAALVVFTSAIFLASVFVALATPVAMGADQVPAIVSALRDKLDSLFGLLQRLQGTDGSARPPPAEIANGNPLSPLLNIALTSTSAAAGLLIFTATVYFYLAAHRKLKAKLLRLCLGRSARQVAGTFFEEVETRIASYFGVVTVINLVMGVLTAAIAWAAGFSYPLFWGALAFVFNYLAFVGPILVIGLLFGAGLIDDARLFETLWPAGAYFVLHLVEANIATPSLIGRRLTVSPFMVFLSFVFWLWLWGPVGAVLSTPLLLIGMVMLELLTSANKGASQAPQAAPAAASAAGTPAAEPRSLKEGDAASPAPVPIDA
jgi:predicted PurR-regulated permease PerM